MPGNWPASDFALDLRYQAKCSPDGIPGSGFSLVIPTWAICAIASQGDLSSIRLPTLVTLSQVQDWPGAPSPDWLQSSPIHYLCNLLVPQELFRLRHSFNNPLIMIRPSMLAIDLIIPLLVLHAQTDLAFWIPVSYLTSSQRPRALWLQELDDTGRIAVFHPYCEDYIDPSLIELFPAVDTCVWLLIFPDNSHTWNTQSFRNLWALPSPGWRRGGQSSYSCSLSEFTRTYHESGTEIVFLN